MVGITTAAASVEVILKTAVTIPTKEETMIKITIVDMVAKVAAIVEIMEMEITRIKAIAVGEITKVMNPGTMKVVAVVGETTKVMNPEMIIIKEVVIHGVEIHLGKVISFKCHSLSILDKIIAYIINHLQR